MHVILLLLATHLLTSPVFGQGTRGLGWTPPLIDVEVQPQRETSLEISLRNSTPSPVELEFELGDLVQRPGEGYAVAERGESERSCAGWITLPAQTLTLDPGGSTIYRCPVEVPRGVRGTYSAAITWSPRPPGAEEAAGDGMRVGVNVQYRMCTLVHLTVGEPRPSDLRVEITDMRISRGPKGELVVGAEVRNMGAFNIGGEGRLIVRDERGRRLREVPLGHGTGTVMAEQATEFRTVFSKPPPPGIYSVDATVSYGTRGRARAQRRFEITGEGGAQAEGAVVQALQLEVEPEVALVTAAPGAFTGSVLTLTNEGERAIKVSTDYKWLGLGQAGEPLVSESPTRLQSAQEWVQVNPSELLLPPGAKRRVRLAVQPPEQASGGCYAALVFQAEPVDAKPDEELLPTETAITVLVTVGPAPEVGAVAGVFKPLLSPEIRGAMFLATVENAGSAHFRISKAELLLEKLRPAGSDGVRLLDDEGASVIAQERWEPVGQGQAKVAKHYVLPGAVTQIEATYFSDLEPGEYRATLVTACDPGDTRLQQVTRFKMPDWEALAREQEKTHAEEQPADGRLVNVEGVGDGEQPKKEEDAAPEAAHDGSEGARAPD